MKQVRSRLTPRPQPRQPALLRARRLGVLPLESRDVPAIFSSFDGSTLSIVSDAGDAISVANVGGNVKINGADPGTGPVAVGSVLNLSVVGGPGANVIDLSAVSEADGFNLDLSVSIRGAGGADTINGSQFDDQFFWAVGDGNDTAFGNGGTDTINSSGSGVTDVAYSFPTGGGGGFRQQFVASDATTTVTTNSVEVANDSIAADNRAYSLSNSPNTVGISASTVLVSNDTATTTFLFSSVPGTSFAVTGGIADDTFTFNGIGGTPSAGATVDGGAGANSLELLGNAAGAKDFSRADYTYTAANQALELALDGNPALTLPRVQAVSDRVSAKARSFDFTEAGGGAIGVDPVAVGQARLTVAAVARAVEFGVTGLSGGVELSTSQAADTVTFSGLGEEFPSPSPFKLFGPSDTLVIARGFDGGAEILAVDVNLVGTGTGAVSLGDNPILFTGLSAVVQAVGVGSALSFGLTESADTVTLGNVTASADLARLAQGQFTYDFVSPGSAGTLTVNGRGGDDVLTFAGLNPDALPGAFRFDGGGGTNVLNLTGTPNGEVATSIAYDLGGRTVTIDAQPTVLGYTNVRTLTDAIPADDRTATLPTTADAATLSAGADADDGFSLLAVNSLGFDLDFRNPSENLRIEGNAGDDTIIFAGLDTADRPATSTLIDGGTGTNIGRFQVAADDAAYSFGDDSTITFDDFELRAANFFGFFDDATRQTLTINLPADAQETLNDNGVVGDGRSRLTSASGDFTEFLNPSQSLAVNGTATGSETITFQGYDYPSGATTTISIDFGASEPNDATRTDTLQIKRPTSDVVFDFPQGLVSLDALKVNYKNQRITELIEQAPVSLTFKLKEGVTERLSDDEDQAAVSKLQLLAVNGVEAEIQFMTLFRLPSSLLQFDFNTGDETLIYSGLDPIGRPSAGVKISGGDGSDSIVLQQSGVSRIEYAVGAKAVAVIDGFSVGFDGIELFRDEATGNASGTTTLAAQRRSFDFDGGNLTVTLSKLESEANYNTLDVTETTGAADETATTAVLPRFVFLSPASQLDISTSTGSDTVTINSLNLAVPNNESEVLTLSIFTSSGKDRIFLQQLPGIESFIDGGTPTLTPPTDQGDSLKVFVERDQRILQRDPEDPRSGTILPRGDGNFGIIRFTDIEDLVGENPSLAVKLFAAGTGPSPRVTAPLPAGITPQQFGVSPSQVVVYNADYSIRFRFTPFGNNFTGSVSVATADVNGDLTDDIIVGAGAGGGPHVRIFDGVTLNEIASFFAFNPAFTGGVTVAAHDLDEADSGDGLFRAEVVVGAGAGGGPNVRVYRFSGGLNSLQAEMFWDFFAFAPNFVGGVTVAAGTAGVVVGAGPGGGPHVRVFDPLQEAVTFDQFVFNNPSYAGGVTVAAGSEIPGATANSAARFAASMFAGINPVVPEVWVYTDTNGTWTPRSFYAFGANFFGGANIAMFNPRPESDENEDNQDQIVVGTPRANGLMRILDLNGVQLFQDRPFGINYSNGIYVG